MEKVDYASIVMLTYRTSRNNRAALTRQCLDSLLKNTKYPYELILIDNTQNNRNLGGGRNLGISMATGKYLVIADDDIIFKKGWLTECIKMVELGDKFMATPVHQHRVGRWELEPVAGYRHNRRTGSNCMVMRMTDFNKIGEFGSQPVGIEGGKYHDRIVHAGYTFLITKTPLAIDEGFRRPSYDQEPIRKMRHAVRGNPKISK